MLLLRVLHPRVPEKHTAKDYAYSYHMPKVEHQGASAHGVTDSSCASTTISTRNRELLELPNPAALSTVSIASEPSYVLSAVRMLQLRVTFSLEPEVRLYIIDCQQKLSLLPEPVSFDSKPTDSGYRLALSNEILTNNVSRSLKKSLQGHAWTCRLLEVETCETEVAGPAKTSVDFPALK